MLFRSHRPNLTVLTLGRLQLYSAPGCLSSYLPCTSELPGDRVSLKLHTSKLLLFKLTCPDVAFVGNSCYCRACFVGRRGFSRHHVDIEESLLNIVMPLPSVIVGV